jgi:hypothetical protein
VIKAVLKSIISFVAGVCVAGGVYAQSQILYVPGRTIKDQNIGVKGWGSGTIAESTDAAYEGTTSIRVSFRNAFQGGIVQFGAPVDLGGAFGDRANMLRFALRLADSNMVLGGRSGGGNPGSPGADGDGGAAGGRNGGGGGGAGMTGLRGGAMGGPPGSPMGGPQAGAPAPSNSADTEALKTLRMIITTTDGKRSEVYVSISNTATGQRGWRLAAVPLQSIKGFDKTNKIVKSIAFSGDATSTIYVGDIRVVNDTTKIQADTTPKGPLNLALGDSVEFTAYGFGGASVLKFSWDFDASDGISTDAEGQVVKIKFRKPGKFIVTLTVTDEYGLKQGASRTIQVTVNP